MILHATRRLIDARPADERPGWRERDVLVRTVGRLGTIEDARALQRAFCDDPQGQEDLLPALLVLADSALARELFATATADGRLREGMPEDLLHLFGYHGLHEAEPMLWAYARGDGTWSSAGGPAVRGLLHLPCSGLREEIADTILGYGEQSLFQEYVPALAVKTGRMDLLDVLFRMGETTSPDCNGGLVLGMALYGDAARSHVGEAIWSPAWEADSTGSGTLVATHDALCVLGISMRDLFTEWRRRVESGDAPLHGVSLLTNLLGERMRRWHTGLRFAPQPPDRFADVHAALYGPVAEDFPGAARVALERATYPFTDLLVLEIETLEQALLARMAEEQLLGEVRPD